MWKIEKSNQATMVSVISFARNMYGTSSCIFRLLANVAISDVAVVVAVAVAVALAVAVAVYVAVTMAVAVAVDVLAVTGQIR